MHFIEMHIAYILLICICICIIIIFIITIDTYLFMNYDTNNYNDVIYSCIFFLLFTLLPIKMLCTCMNKERDKINYNYLLYTFENTTIFFLF